MSEIKIIAEREYSVALVEDWVQNLESAINPSENCFFLYPALLSGQIPSQFKGPNSLALPDAESQKSGAVFLEVLAKMAEIGLDRDGTVVGIGGGATTDLSGFAAATYLRGVNWIAIPTTVAAMVDAAIGGKTGINLDMGKNLVGAFHSPIRVIVDLEWIESLSPRDLAAGLVESIKCGFIDDPTILKLVSSSPRENLMEIIERSIRVKAKIVSADFKESYAREALNYGHTLGHAIEQHSGYQLRHGEAVSIGLVFAGNLSVRVEGLSREIADQHRSILESIGMPTRYQFNAFSELFSLMNRDKKRKNQRVRFVTLKRLGETGRSSDLSFELLEEIFMAEIAR